MLLLLVQSFVSLSKIVFWIFQAIFCFTEETYCKVCNIFLMYFFFFFVACLLGLICVTQICPVFAFVLHFSCIWWEFSRFPIHALGLKIYPPFFLPLSLLPFFLLFYSSLSPSLFLLCILFPCCPPPIVIISISFL